ncbi:Centriolin [Frankliniella fusca]|uniref:Centriolin n=1 Tax=Frankliniella fusca TaxID=407009 RepID=A0AAE1H0C2_9NEOP|nr:Centriolin [Frankliniella fusca]
MAVSEQQWLRCAVLWYPWLGSRTRPGYRNKARQSVGGPQTPQPVSQPQTPTPQAGQQQQQGQQGQQQGPPSVGQSVPDQSGPGPLLANVGDQSVSLPPQHPPPPQPPPQQHMQYVIHPVGHPVSHPPGHPGHPHQVLYTPPPVGQPVVDSTSGALFWANWLHQ